MRQILYVSTSVTSPDRTPLAAILEQSRHNNALDGVTGLLWSDGERFAQVVEGDDDAIAHLVERLRGDSRHRDMTILHDRAIGARQFGDWSMELRGAAADPDVYDARMRRALDDASEAIRSVFASLIAAGEA